MGLEIKGFHSRIRSMGFDLEEYHTIYFNDPFQLDNDIVDS